MRFALSSHANPSHLVGVLAAARAVRAAGHDVVVVSGPSVAEKIERAGFPMVPVPSLMSTDEIIAALTNGTPWPRSGPPDRPPAHPFITPWTHQQAADITDALRPLAPDCVLRDSTELGGYIAAQCLGVPHGTVDIAPLSPCAAPGALAELNQLRAGFGLPEVDDPWHSVRSFRIGLVPADYYPPELRWPEANYYQPSVADEAADAEPCPLPAGDGPLVLASLGMNAPVFDQRASALLNAIITALGELPVTGVVALGMDPDGWAGARPDNVRLESFVPQRALLRHCGLFITHAGFNGVREAFGAGVPMVAVPLFGDHPASARRLGELGVAAVVDPAAATADAMRAAIGRVLDDPGFRDRAARLRRRMGELARMDRMPDDLRALVAGTAPVIGK
ncbi:MULTISPECIES: glycosyltransferase [unclassified Nocardia]|uniref:glycosyltransferase n=1 Tax=unclassified Nocardia TaxID=2637762 RepID=UPI001CE421D9|nr:MULTISPECIES: glycosyltransferase [unclassified Nocardia]